LHLRVVVEHPSAPIEFDQHTMWVAAVGPHADQHLIGAGNGDDPAQVWHSWLRFEVIVDEQTLRTT